MWDGFNQRKFPRLHLKCEITVDLPSEKRKFQVQTENVGLGGICVTQENDLDRFSSCRIKIHFNDDKPAIECDGKIAWIIAKSDAKRNRRVYDTGIEFLGLTNIDKNRLDAYLQDAIQSEFKDLV